MEVSFHLPGGKRLAAVDGVSLQCARGQCVGLVGESGSGKTTVANAIVGLLHPQGGSISAGGVSIWPSPDTVRVRARTVQMVFQDPYGALNPRMTVGGALGEVLDMHGDDTGNRVGDVSALLDQVELPPVLANSFPHELSGGQRQRVCIARALAVKPAWIVADEPVSALDVSVQVQVLNLLRQLQLTLHLGILFIAHDLATVRYMCDDVHVMHAGRIVESGAAARVFAKPQHAYTQALLAAVPDVEAGLAARRR